MIYLLASNAALFREAARLIAEGECVRATRAFELIGFLRGPSLRRKYQQIFDLPNRTPELGMNYVERREQRVLMLCFAAAITEQGGL